MGATLLSSPLRVTLGFRFLADHTLHPARMSASMMVRASARSAPKQARGMASEKQLRMKIASTTNIAKITSSMKMVAAAKMRGDEQRLNAGKLFGAIFARLYKAPEGFQPNPNRAAPSVPTKTLVSCVCEAAARRPRGGAGLGSGRRRRGGALCSPARLAPCVGGRRTWLVVICNTVQQAHTHHMAVKWAGLLGASQLWYARATATRAFLDDNYLRATRLNMVRYDSRSATHVFFLCVLLLRCAVALLPSSSPTRPTRVCAAASTLVSPRRRASARWLWRRRTCR